MVAAAVVVMVVVMLVAVVVVVVAVAAAALAQRNGCLPLMYGRSKSVVRTGFHHRPTPWQAHVLSAYLKRVRLLFPGAMYS